LFADHCKADRESYTFRVYSKTASLFETSAKAAALISPVDESTVELMRAYGYNIGMAFQIIDDILDFTSEPTTLGKPVGNDLRQGIITLPAILYAETHAEDPNARDLLEGRCIPSDEKIEDLINSIRNSDSIATSHQEALRYVEAGIKSLRQLQPSSERFALEDLANYIVQREL
jgi:geranylgeranyl pyrophosphate synthase